VRSLPRSCLRQQVDSPFRVRAQPRNPRTGVRGYVSQAPLTSSPCRTNVVQALSSFCAVAFFKRLPDSEVCFLRLLWAHTASLELGGVRRKQSDLGGAGD
jgi:hypothetical protein